MLLVVIVCIKLRGELMVVLRDIKAYLVAKVFTEQEGIGYIKTFNPVVKPITVYFCCFPGLAD
jgi:hypothetical protein